MKNRSYNFSLTLTGRINITDEDAKEIIANFNEAVAQKREGYQMVTAVTGGAPVDESNLDKVYETAMRAGFRRAVRNGGLDDFRDLDGAQAIVTLEPRGSALSTPKENADE